MIVLLIVLFLLEMVVHPGIKQWLASAISGVNSSFANAGNNASSASPNNPLANVPILGWINQHFNSNLGQTQPTGIPTQVIPRPPGGNCPPGFAFNPGTGQCQK